jgi:hypothetical protein
VLVETLSAPDGQFALDLPLAGPSGTDFRLPLKVEAQDGSQAVLCEAYVEIAPGEQASITLSLPDYGEIIPAYEPTPPPPLVDAEAAAVLRERVRAFIDRGELPEVALSMLEAAVQPLEWAAALLPEALAALKGDMEAGARLRAALLDWSVPVPDDEPVEELDGEGQEVETAQNGVVDTIGLLPIALAAQYVSASPREAQQLLDGLAAAVWSRPWVDLLFSAARLGEPGPMRTLMGGMPGNIPGLQGGGIQGGPPDESFPVKPGSKVPGKKTQIPGIRVHPTVLDVVPHFRNPVNLPPSDRELCLVAAMAEVARIKQSLPRYTIQAFDNPNACAGQPLTITGQNFGSMGQVVFPGVAQPVNAEVWSNTSIRVIVPIGTAPGKIRLSIFEMHLKRCKKDFDIYRPGDTLPEFTGGVPQIISLWVDSVQGNNSAEPETDVNIWFETSQGGSVTARLIITNTMGAVVFSTPSLPGGAHSITFRTPAAPTGPVDLTVTLRTQGVCEAAERAYTLTITRQPDLRIVEMEVTQGIQRLDNSVRLAAHRRTLVRLYLTNGLFNHLPFSYTTNGGELPGVTGSVTLWRGSQQLAVVSPTPAVITSRIFFWPYVREALDITLNFWLPVEHLNGPLRLEAHVWLAEPPHGVIVGPHTTDVHSLNLTFQPTNHVRIVRVMLRDDWRKLPAPTDSQFNKALRGASARLPFPDDGFEIHLPPGSPVLGTNHDLTTEDGWEFVLEDIDDIAGDTANAWSFAWTGLIAAQEPQSDKPKLKAYGIGRPGNGEHDYPAMACQANLPATFAHELVHVFGYGHAGCPATGEDAPKYVDSSLPAYIEDYAVDLYTLATFQPGFTGAGEIMSYCGGPNRWTSIFLWHKLMDLLKV